MKEDRTEKNEMEEREEEEGAKPFLDHLEDLRWLVIKSVVAIVVCMLLSLLFSEQILAVLQAPLVYVLEKRGMDSNDFLVILNVVDPLTIVIQTGLLAGIVFASPLVCTFIGQFVLPALTPMERKMLLPAFIGGAGLFLAGCVFCYFLILPVALDFFIGWAIDIGGNAVYSFQKYIGFVLQMLVAFGLSFELPLVIIILSKLGIVTQDFLKTYRKHAFVLILLFAACITPTSDPYSLTLLTLPMYILFEASILAAGWIERDKARADAKEII